MIKLLIQLIAVFILAAQMTGCSTLSHDEGKADSKQVANTQPSTQSPAAAENPSMENNDQPVPSVQPAPKDSAKPIKLYRMNEAYRFVPIEESSPDKVVLLTFDDGLKDEAVLTSMLDTLDKHAAKAVFFVNGYRVKQNPQLLELIHQRGQTIGNHSWDHINLKNENEEIIEKQISDLQTKIESLIGEKPLFFRPPFGSGGDIVKKIVKNHGMLYMTWSNGSLDWDKSTKDKPDEVIRNVMEQLHPGANILMHELQWTADALDELLTKLKDKGYGFIDPAAIAAIR
ncbi:polysaccharide deacetylase family protein [Paenibacillus alkaliterrae]|uniref:polysaccharide deacetylase family protein n=1 Tax=Paenibacillus alkaliterrae TaxID=320909 RepID=UPI001F1D39D6|nr:polysaccharide deacetylase family protein [Paenibacillus alkaliterrae]MCF2937577.1 polysaccharide deacetylase family protein [Paenibacillus alkaliterrae]